MHRQAYAEGLAWAVTAMKAVLLPTSIAKSLEARSSSSVAPVSSSSATVGYPVVGIVVGADVGTSVGVGVGAAVGPGVGGHLLWDEYVYSYGTCLGRVNMGMARVLAGPICL